jgi:probable F420-dependent oxidoreductase
VDIGRVGIWDVGLRSEDPRASGEIREAAAELEALGYGAIWLGGSPDVGQAGPLLAATSRIVVATGILNIWRHDAAGVAARHAALGAAHPGRLLLGLGVSHARFVEQYRRPLAAMREYLDALDAAAAPVPESERALAALGPRMLELARERTSGAHPYLVTVEHTRRAREVLGEGPLLAPELKVVVDTDAGRARSVARRVIDRVGYLRMPNYANNLVRLGFTEGDLAGGGSDRLIDAVTAWGDADAIRERIADHHRAGADHVCLQVLTADGTALPRAEWRHLAEALSLRSAIGRPDPGTRP